MKMHVIDTSLILAGLSGLTTWFIRNDDLSLEKLRDRLVDLHERATTIQAKADGEQRDLTEDEQTELDHLTDEFGVVEADIERRERILAQGERLKASTRRTDPEGPRAGEDEEEQDLRNAQRNAGRPGMATRPRRRSAFEFPFEDKGKWGWRDQGEFFTSVARAVVSNGNALDDRLKIRGAATTYGQEGAGADGGFAVPPDFRTAIMQKVMGEDSLVSRTDQFTSSSNVANFPIDNVSPWDTTAGIQAYWDDEASTAGQSKPALDQGGVRLNRIRTLVPVTEELLEDAPGMTGFINSKAPVKINFAINLAILQGNGVARPLGILNSGCLVSVAKQASQAADTIVAENIFKMWSRMYAPCRSRAVWLINQDIEPQLHNMHVRVQNAAATDYVGGGPVYMPAGGLSGSPFATLYGRPIIPTEACNQLGDQGDIIFGDLSQYMTIMKVGGMRQDVSMHVYFEQNMMAFRFTMRIGGRPWWPNAITRRSGANTLSCFVTLDERA